MVWLWARVPLALRQLYYDKNFGFSLGDLLLPDQEDLFTIKSGLNKGLKMRFNPNRYRDYYFGTYEKDVQTVLQKIVQKNMIAFNIGANLGFFTLALCQIVGAEGFVVAFEPNPKVRNRLVANLQLNSIEKCVRVEKYALSDFDGEAGFSLSLGDGRGRFENLPDVKRGYTIQVPCKRLDTYIAEERLIPDVLLIDVEYAEGRVLRGMRETLKGCKPIVVIEMHSLISIEESLKELKMHDYFIASIPELKIFKHSDKITRGHYLTAHRNYLEVLDR